MLAGAAFFGSFGVIAVFMGAFSGSRFPVVELFLLLFGITLGWLHHPIAGVTIGVAGGMAYIGGLLLSIRMR